MKLFRQSLPKKQRLFCSCSSCEGKQVEQNETPLFLKIVYTLFILSIVFIGSCRVVHASTVSDKQAVLAIIGEAENQGFKGLLAVACAIRNRGTLQGVYGLHNPRVIHHRYSQKTYLLAKKAWAMSKTIDITKRATGWGNAKDINEFAKARWWKNCIVVARIKDHIFYTEKRYV